MHTHITTYSSRGWRKPVPPGTSRFTAWLAYHRAADGRVARTLAYLFWEVPDAWYLVRHGQVREARDVLRHGS